MSKYPRESILTSSELSGERERSSLAIGLSDSARSSSKSKFSKVPFLFEYLIFLRIFMDLGDLALAAKTDEIFSKNLRF